VWWSAEIGRASLGRMGTGSARPVLRFNSALFDAYTAFDDYMHASTAISALTKRVVPLPQPPGDTAGVM